MRVKAEDILKTTFSTQCRHYEFLVISFGMTNAPTVFICLMSQNFSHYFDKFVVIFIDDILMYFQRREEHVEHMRTILHILRQEQLYGKHNKCEF